MLSSIGDTRNQINKVDLILGPPGTGKTTRLLNILDRCLISKTALDKVAFISFTKKSINEAMLRANERFHLPKDSFVYFRTIHSLAFRQLALSSSQVMDRSAYIDFGRTMGIYITGIHREDQMIYEMAKGDQLNFLDSLAKLKCQTLEDALYESDADISLQEANYFREAMDRYKQVHHLLDFTDMLTRYNVEGPKPELDVLFVDEAQDLCALQWSIVNQLIANTKQTYIAGDDDQAIFRWSGAAVEYFLGLSKKYSTTVLDRSYRLPKNIHSFSGKLISQIKKRNVKKFASKETSGHIEYVSNIQDIKFDSGRWLILIRNGFLMPDIVEHIRLLGLPYETTYYSIEKDKAIEAANSWESLRKGLAINGKQATNMSSFMSLEVIGNRTKLSKSMSVKMVDFAREFKINYLATVDEMDRVRIWHEVLDLIPVNDREYYISVRRRGEHLIGKPRIKISTIHGAKGGEEENVVLFTDMSAKTYKGMEKNYEDEVRVFYVACTRSSKNLYIVQPQTTNYFQL